MARKFARAGHRIFHVSPKFMARKSVRVRRIEKNLFALSLPGDPNASISTEQPCKDALKTMADSLYDFCLDSRCSTGASMIQSPCWTGLAEILRKQFGWPMIRDCTADAAAGHASTDGYDELNSNIVRAFPKVSVIIAIHNNLELNKSCLSSILGKTDYPNYEVILVDNASTDGSREFALELSRSDDRVRVDL